MKLFQIIGMIIAAGIGFFILYGLYDLDKHSSKRNNNKSNNNRNQN